MLSQEKWDTILLLPPSFWINVQDLGNSKSQKLNAGLRLFKAQFEDLRKTLTEIHFPIHASSHWFLATISFKHKQFHIRDGLTSPHPDFCTPLKNLFSRFLDLDLSKWELRRKDCPQQLDGHSCGVIVLSMMEQLSLDKPNELWKPEKASQHRREWLKRAIQRHETATQLLQKAEEPKNTKPETVCAKIIIN
jgi:hypothetical protein